MSCARPAVQAIGDSIEFVLTVDRQVGAFGKVLIQQFVGVFASAALQRAVWVAEVPPYACGGGKFLMPREFLALVICEALPQGFRNRVEFGEEAGQS